jgi:hypothetical protein
MSRHRLQSALGGRGFLLFPAAAFAVHQLRYELAYGSRSGAALSAQGHGYLNSLAPWVVVLLSFAAGSFLVRLARTAAGHPRGRPRRAFGALWLAGSVLLLATYSAQEWLEGVFAAGHPGGIAGIFGHGGWWAIVLSLLAGLAVAALLGIATALLDAVEHPLSLFVPAARALARPAGALLVRWAPLAGAAAGRAPPATCVAA